MLNVAPVAELRDYFSVRTWNLVYLREENQQSPVEQLSLTAIRLWKQFSGKDKQENEKVRAGTEAAKMETKSNSTGNESRKRTHSSAFSSRLRTPRTAPSPPHDAKRAASRKTRSGTHHGDPEYSVERDPKVARLTKLRDGGLCAVSRLYGVEACHIYPWCAFGCEDKETPKKREEKQRQIREFWGFVEMFWPAEKVARVKAKIFKDHRTTELRGTETVANMITLCSTLHRYHTYGLFALRPVRETNDGTQLEVEFHWLPPQERAKDTRMNLMDVPPSSHGLTGTGAPGQYFIRYDDGPLNPTPLQSGTRFTMTTDDPVKKPLPDAELLELQWFMQRILTLSGAAGWKEEDFDHDTDASVDPLLAVEQSSDVASSVDERQDIVPSTELPGSGPDVEQWIEGVPSDPSRSSSQQSPNSFPRSRSSSLSGSVEILDEDGPYT